MKNEILYTLSLVIMFALGAVMAWSLMRNQPQISATSIDVCDVNGDGVVELRDHSIYFAHCIPEQK